jgi:hypothetical protein
MCRPDGLEREKYDTMRLNGSISECQEFVRQSGQKNKNWGIAVYGSSTAVSVASEGAYASSV